jgi:hypothetical protein
MRATASLRRLSAMTPERTCSSVLRYNSCQLSGAMNRSSPALKDWAHATVLQPSTWPWPFQSPTRKPSKPMRPTSTSFSISR